MNTYITRILPLLKVYVVVVLIIAAILSPLTLSFVPILLLIWYLYSWRWPITAIISLLTEYFMFFAVVLLLSNNIGYLFSLLLAIPVVVLINHSLRYAAEALVYRDTEYVRNLTNTGKALSLIAVVVLGISLLLGSLPLITASSIIIAYFIVIGVLILRNLPVKPIEENQLPLRTISGSENQVNIELNVKTKIGGLLFLKSPYEWQKVSPDILTLEGKRLAIKVSLTPMLSGPSVTKIKCYATDCWGLTQTKFEIEPISLYVIPRARYAAWLAKKYMASTKPCALPLLSNMEALKPIYGLRRGIEYYGSRLYQPGDSLKSIDWKHSLKYNELITKEFTEFHGQPAIILINLAISNEEEKDKLAYNIIVAAISLAREDIPAALAAYDHKDVKLTTGLLHHNQLILKSLQISKELVIFNNPIKYLSPPDVTRIKANMGRIRYSESQAARVLTELMQLEYRSLSNAAKLNPATRALSKVFDKVDKQSNIIIISHRNHDAEALVFNTFVFTKKGNAVINI